MQLSQIRHQEADVIFESGYNKNAQMDLLLDVEGRKEISRAGEFLRNKKWNIFITLDWGLLTSFDFIFDRSIFLDFSRLHD